MTAELKVVGKRLPMVDSIPKVTGKALYTQDLSVPGTLFAKILRSPHAHATITEIDTSKAKALPGVVDVLTYKDIPPIRYKDVYIFGAEKPDRVYFAGDEVAVAIATNEEIAEDALALIAVKYEVLPAILSIEDAIRPEAPVVRIEKGNVALKQSHTRGDITKGFAEADFVFEFESRAPQISNALLEPRCTYSCITDQGVLNVWFPSQGPYRIMREVASSYKLPLNKVRVFQQFTGPAMGATKAGKSYMIAPLVNQRTLKPVFVNEDSEGEFNANHGRWQSISYLKIGVKKDGTITAIETKIYSLSGARIPVGSAGMDCASTLNYSCPNVKFENYFVYANRTVTGHMRGVGVVQSHFHTEVAIDEIAYKLGIDPVEFRIKCLETKMEQVRKLPYSTYGILECVRKGAEAIGWKAKWHKPGEKTLPTGKKQGIGMAAYAYPYPGGLGKICTTYLNFQSDGKVQLFSGLADVGQGSKTTACQIVAEVLGLKLEDVIIYWGDSFLPETNEASGSSTTLNALVAVKRGAENLRSNLFSEAALMLKVKPEELEARDEKVYIKGTENFVKIADVITSARGKNFDLIGVGDVGPRPASHGVPKQWTAQCGATFVELEVDVETGEVSILKLVQLTDIGKALNPMIVEQQFEGTAVIGQGLATTEELLVDGASGVTLNPNYLDFKVLTALDACDDIEVSLIETNDPWGAFGAKSGGEQGLCAVAPAVANAIYNAIGVRLNSIPATPDRILKALGKI